MLVFTQYRKILILFVTYQEIKRFSNVLANVPHIKRISQWCTIITSFSKVLFVYNQGVRTLWLETHTTPNSSYYLSTVKCIHFLSMWRHLRIPSLKKTTWIWTGKRRKSIFSNGNIKSQQKIPMGEILQKLPRIPQPKLTSKYFGLQFLNLVIVNIHNNDLGVALNDVTHIWRF